MTENYVRNLTQIYNTLLLVNTRGEDTIIMAECLKALQQVIENGAKDVGLTLQQGPAEEEEEESQAEIVED